MNATIQLCVGMQLYGYCGGHFGRDGYSTKRIEALGVDWVVARDADGHVYFASGPDIQELTRYATEEERLHWEHLA